MNARTRRRSLFLALAAIPVLVSCSDRPSATEPTAVRTLTKLQSWKSLTGNEMTILDPVNGLTYTLNIAQRRVNISDGHAILLDVDQTKDWAARFASTVSNDSVANVLMDLTYFPPTPPDSCPTGYNCHADEMRVGLEPLGGHAGRRSLSSEYPWQFSPVTRLPIGIPVANEYADVCTNVAQVAYSAQHAYRDKRAGFIRSAIRMLFVEATTQLLEKFLGSPGGSIAAEVDIMMLEQVHEEIQMGFLTAIWNDHSCGNRHINLGKVYVGHPSTSSPSANCFPAGEDSIVIGGVEFPVTVTICIYDT